MKLFLLLSAIITHATLCIAQNNFKDSLVKELDTISQDDQIYRQQLDWFQSKYGSDSKEMKNLIKLMREKDSVNLIKVESILNKYGWLGSDVLGYDGNETLFFVIQHADSATREKYLPLMRDAVKKGNAKANELALLEDRVALEHKRKQVYGSQVYWNMKTNEYYVFPMIDPANVDKRRASVGLPSMDDYLSIWQLKWSLEQYKKDSAKIKMLNNITYR